MTSKKGSDLLVNVLTDWGIKEVYGLPGDSVDTTVDALRRQKDKIKFIQVRHEEVASLAASASAKYTGKIGVCLSIGGPGAIHLLNGLYDAKMDHVPVLALLGQVTSQSLNEGYFQEVNTPKLFDDVAVFNRTISSVDNLAEIVDQAIRSAYENKGVAVLTIPDDIPDQELKTIYHSSAKAFSLAKPSINEEQINKASELIKNSQKPIALIGLGAKESGEEVTSFLEKNNIPFVQTLPAKGTISDDHPNSLSNVGKLGTKPAYEAMKNADLLILLGSNYPYLPYLPNKGQAKCIQVDLKAENLGKRYSVTTAIQADVYDVVHALNKKGVLRDNKSFLQACQKNMDNWNKWMQEKRELDTTPISPESMVAYIDQTAPDDLVYSIDVGTSTSWAARFLHVKRNQKFAISAWLGTMGCGLPGAIAGQIVFPKRRVLSLIGDGAFSMVMQDFVTAVKYKLPIIFVIINNQKLAFIEYEQQSAGQLNYEINLADIDFGKFAQAAGGIGITVKSNDKFKEALDQAYQTKDKPVLINAYVEDNAPLPGKIVLDEAKGFAKFGQEYLENYWKIPELPPFKDILRQFF
ncbi:pyruvate oxidase [Oenococcus oeni]|uniref:pyruvate oxidase n=1 Tax=Oenococcus oeni TaxID=1247 RepID=UPI0008F97379|nr:pyruvate oxidase [Oenococcus oeni]AZZ60747.1 pyruvate oxidase [Oenococcus sp. UCMA 16435]OIM22470.1 pyruvate oxidase [Oenococcus oeni]OIM24211.1 pyruvate oxidase [Oenococcus oeni]SYW15639.1 acetyl-phosphate generating pyruvate oxidase [Oenococcus oeni]